MSAHASELQVFDAPLDGVQLIEASAGTGKTWNLSALVVRLVVESRLTVDRILVVTFTTAATAELRERIRARLADTQRHLMAGAAAPEDPFVTPLREAWARRGLSEAEALQRIDGALLNFDEASIFTIHSFCQRALADAPVAAGMPVASTLLPDDLDLRQQAAADFWRRHVTGVPISPLLAVTLRRRKDSPPRWAELLKATLAKPLSRVVWAAPEAASAVDLQALQAQFDHARTLWQRDETAIVDRVMQSLDNLPKSQFKATTVAESRQIWNGLFAIDDALQVQADANSLKRAALLGTARLKPNKGKPPVPPHPFFDAAQAWLDGWAQAQSQGDALRRELLQRWIEEGPVQLRELRRSARVITYDDMLFNLHERLCGDGGAALAQRLRQRFAAALIDEFQDTDPLQWSVFSRIWGENAAPHSPPLFLIGDPKQAIYGFRNADLGTYLGAARSAARKHWLSDNQRADEPLVTALNALFGAHDAPFMRDGLGYPAARFGGKKRPVFIDANGPQAPLQLWELPWTDGLPPSRAQAQALAAQACAAGIAALLRDGRAGRITRDGRPLAGGDIAVLVRSHRQGRLIREALQRVGVDSVELAQASVFSTPDARELSAVLRAVLEPTHEGTVRAALATALIGLDAAALLALEDDPDALPTRMDRLARCREIWQRRGLAALWRQLSQDEGVRERLLARPDGPRRLTNVLHLVELLHAAAQTLASPAEQLRWLDERRQLARSAEEAEQLRLETDRHLVQVVTVHRSKGLEYGIVFCPFVWDGQSAGPREAWRSAHDDEGRPTLHFDGLQDETLKARLRRATAEEDLRLLYVALTRAVHRCCVVTGLYGSRGSAQPCKASRRAMWHWLAAGGVTGVDGWLNGKDKVPEAARITSAWQALAQACPGAISLQPLPLPDAGEATHASPEAPPVIAARASPARLPRGLWIGSYSRLVHNARAEEAAPDHDDRVDADGPAPARAGPAPGDDILDFPRGPDAGHCLHAVFESADFTQPQGWDAAVAGALRTKAPPLDGLATDQAHAMLRRMLADVVATPLGDGLQLDRVPRARCRAEFEFALPAGALDTSELRAALLEHGYSAPLIPPAQLQGLLRGFMDMVLEDRGRWFIVDWKSNHLGRTAEDYARAALDREMARHHYPVQALLYTVALHRHLACRLRGYDYGRHFGGVRYLFVRGVRPGWRGGDGASAGVWNDRPPLALVQRLDAMFTAMELEP